MKSSCGRAFRAFHAAGIPHPRLSTQHAGLRTVLDAISLFGAFRANGTQCRLLCRGVGASCRLAPRAFRAAVGVSPAKMFHELVHFVSPDAAVTARI